MGSVHRRFNRANIESLQSLDYQVELTANFDDGDGPEVHNQHFVMECNKNGIMTHSIPFERHSMVSIFRCMPQVKKLLRERKYDLIHAHTETGGLILRLAKNVKCDSLFVYTPHGMSFWNGSSFKSQMLYRPLERWICSKMDANLAMNHEELDFLRQLNPKTAHYVHGIGLDLERFQQKGRTKEEIRAEFGVNNNEDLIVSVGELDDNKNHATAIKALSLLKKQDFKYVICGVGPNQNNLLKIAANCGLADKVILAGFRSDISDILHASDIFVFPSLHEGLPVSVLEAMACGLPIVCSKIRGNVDLVIDGKNGFLFPPEDYDSLALSMKKLMDNKSLSQSYGKINLNVVKDFSQKAVVEELKKIYTL